MRLNTDSFGKIAPILILSLTLLTGSLPAGEVISRSAGPIRLEIDPGRGGVLAGLFYDLNRDGEFTADELLLDTGSDQGLVLELVEVPGGRGDVPVPDGGFRPGPRESWFVNPSVRLPAFGDSTAVSESDDAWTAEIFGHFTWGGNWPYRLLWEVPKDGGLVRASLQLLPGWNQPRPSLIRAWGMTLRMRYRSDDGFAARTARFGIDDRVLDVRAEAVRTWTGARNYVKRGAQYGISSAEEIPWPDYNLASLIQSGRGDCRLWKAVDSDVGNLTVWRGRRARGWMSIDGKGWGVGVGLANMPRLSPAAIETDLDTGERTAEIGLYLWPSGARMLDPRGPDGAQVINPGTMVLAPHGGDWSAELETELDRAVGLTESLPSPEPDPKDYVFTAPELPISDDKAISFLVDEPAGIDRAAWPVTVGVPLPKGWAGNLSELLLFDNSGRGAPLQAEPTAFWPDGSIKWVLLDFAADLPAGSGAVYRLEKAAGRASPKAPNEVLAANSPDGVRIETGPLAFEIDRDGSGFLDRVWIDLNDDRLFADDEMIVSAADERRNLLDFVTSGSYRTGDHDVRGVLDRSRLQIDRLEVETAGPLRAVVLIRGHYLNRVASPFTLRLEAFAGKSHIKAQHTFTYAMDPDFDFLLASGLKLPAALGPDRIITFGSDDGPRKLYARPIIGLLSESQDQTLLWESTGDNSVARDLTRFGRPTGWGDISDGRWGVTVSIRNFWQEHAKEVLVDTRSGEITAYFQPPQAAPLDLRRYSRWMYVQTGETTIPWPGRGEFRNGAHATGLAKTSSALFTFHRGMVDPATAEGNAKGFQDRPIAILSPESYRKLEVTGDFSLASDGNFPKIDSAWTGIADFLAWSVEQSNWYGLVDYGDIQHVWRPGFYDENDNVHHRDGWHFDIGRHGWQNTEGLDGLGYFFSFLRTGIREYFDMGMANCRHVQDIDIFHWGPMTGHGHTRHNVNHWGDGDWEIRISQPSVQRYYYYLTGDPRTKDVIERVVDDRFLNFDIHSTADMGAILYGLLVRWEMTGDDKYKNLFQGVVDTYAKLQLKDGEMPLGGFNIDVASGALVGPFKPRTEGYDGFTYDFGLMHALTEYQALTSDKTTWNMLERSARWCVKAERYHMLVLAYVAQKTKNKSILRGVRRSLGNYLDGVYPPDRTHWSGAWPGMRSVGSSSTYGLVKVPLALRALENAGSTEGDVEKENR